MQCRSVQREKQDNTKEIYDQYQYRIRTNRNIFWNACYSIKHAHTHTHTNLKERKTMENNVYQGVKLSAGHINFLQSCHNKTWSFT